MKNIFDIKNWTKQEWNIFINNCRLLAKAHGDDMDDIKAASGKANFFRKDQKQASAHGVDTICNKYKTSREWLGIAQDHPPPIPVPEPNHVNREVSVGISISKTVDILNSGTIYSQALEANINSFYASINLQKELKAYKKRLETMEDEIRRLKNKPLGEANGDQNQTG